MQAGGQGFESLYLHGGNEESSHAALAAVTDGKLACRMEQMTDAERVFEEYP